MTTDYNLIAINNLAEDRLLSNDPKHHIATAMKLSKIPHGKNLLDSEDNNYIQQSIAQSLLAIAMMMEKLIDIVEIDE